jgi:hypothetical protein
LAFRAGAHITLCDLLGHVAIGLSSARCLDARGAAARSALPFGDEFSSADLTGALVGALSNLPADTLCIAPLILVALVQIAPPLIPAFITAALRIAPWPIRQVNEASYADHAHKAARWHIANEFRWHGWTAAADRNAELNRFAAIPHLIRFGGPATELDSL